MRCATHPTVETELRCATCARPICPDCMVETPVGMKCRECGRSPVPPMYRVSAQSLALAMLAGVVVGALSGAVMLVWRAAIGFLLIFFGLLAGVVIGEVAGRAGSGKRGPVIATAVAASCAVGALLLAPQLMMLAAEGVPLPLDELLSVLVRRPFFVLSVGLAAMMAFQHLR